LLSTETLFKFFSAQSAPQADWWSGSARTDWLTMLEHAFFSATKHDTPWIMSMDLLQPGAELLHCCMPVTTTIIRTSINQSSNVLTNINFVTFFRLLINNRDNSETGCVRTTWQVRPI